MRANSRERTLGTSEMGGLRTVLLYRRYMEVDLGRLAEQVRDALSAYVIPPRHPDAVGEPLPDAWFVTGLEEMRAALVTPFWLRMRDLDPETGGLVILNVAVVAEDDAGYFVAFDPSADGEFVLAMREVHPETEINAVACGLRGDAVGCFLSR